MIIDYQIEAKNREATLNFKRNTSLETIEVKAEDKTSYVKLSISLDELSEAVLAMNMKAPQGSTDAFLDKLAKKL